MEERRRSSNRYKLGLIWNMRPGREDGPTSFGRGGFGYDFDMDAILEKMQKTKHMDEVLCRLCYDLPEQPRMTEVGRALRRREMKTRFHCADT